MLDETKNGEQGAPQTTGPSSEAKEGSTSTTTTKTYTDSEIQPIVSKAVSDALAKAGRDAKTLEAREQKLKDIEVREKALAQAEKDAEEARERAEFEAIQDDPDKLSVYQYKKKVREAEELVKAERAKLEADKAAHAEELTFAQKVKRSTLMGEIAREFKDSDPEELEVIADNLGIGYEPERIRALAAVKWAKLEQEKKQVDPLKTDSGVTTGGARPDYAKVSFDKNAPSAEEMIRAGLKKKT